MERTIHHELLLLRQIALELSEHGATNQVCEATATIINGPFNRLFNDLHRSNSPAVLEPVYEVIRLCIRLNRHCRLADQEKPDEPFEPKWFADRLEILSLQLADQLRAMTAA